MIKHEIRKKNLKIRSEILNREEKDEKILQQLLSSDFYKKAKTVMTYISYKSEIDTKKLADCIIKDGKKVCAPVCGENGNMEAFSFSGLSELAKSAMGILEPIAGEKIAPQMIDLIIVPGCAFNSRGYRIGYGGGFYDRYLKKTKAITCGLFYEVLKTEFLPEETDIPLNVIITEEKSYNFT